MTLKTVVIPAAGMGTRMLPATKSVPKELLPVYDTPLMHFALNEAAEAGAERIVVVSHPSKTALETYLRPASRLERALAAKAKHEALDSLRDLSFDDIDIRVVHQEKALGLGPAVLQAREHVEEKAFGVILPDDLLLSGRCLARMARAWDAPECVNLVGAMEVPRETVSSYGIFDLGPGRSAGVRAASGMIEKPDPARAPSTLAAIGRYVLSHDIFDALETTGRGAGGEVQLTDAIAAMPGLHAFEVGETRFDCGSKEGLFEATVAVRGLREAARQPLAMAAE